MIPAFQIYSDDQLQEVFAAQSKTRLEWARNAAKEWPFPTYSEIPYGVPTGLRNACNNISMGHYDTARKEVALKVSLLWKHFYDTGDVGGATILANTGRSGDDQNGPDSRLIKPVILRKGDGTPAADAMKGPILERIEEYFSNGATPDLQIWEDPLGRKVDLIRKLRDLREPAALAMVEAQRRLLGELISQSGNGSDPQTRSLPPGLQFRISISGLFPSPEPEHRVRAYMQETFDRYNLKLTPNWDDKGFDWIMWPHGGGDPFFSSQLHPLIEEKPLGDYRYHWSPRPFPMFTFQSGDLTGPEGLQKYQQLRALLYDAGWRTTPSFSENIVFFTDSLQQHREPQQRLLSDQEYARRMHAIFSAFFSKSMEPISQPAALAAPIEEQMPRALMTRSSGRNLAISAPETTFFNLLTPEQQSEVRSCGSPYVFSGRATHNVLGIPEAQMGERLFIGPSIIDLNLPAASSLRTCTIALSGIGNLLGETMPIVPALPSIHPADPIQPRRLR